MDIRDRIEAMCIGFQVFGYSRVTRQLYYDGFRVKHKKVLSLMRKSDLLYLARRKWVRITDNKHGLPILSATALSIRTKGYTILKQMS